MLEKGKLDCLNEKDLVAQLGVHQMKGDLAIPLNIKIESKADARKELDAAIDRFRAHSMAMAGE